MTRQLGEKTGGPPCMHGEGKKKIDSKMTRDGWCSHLSAMEGGGKKRSQVQIGKQGISCNDRQQRGGDWSTSDKRGGRRRKRFEGAKTCETRTIACLGGCVVVGCGGGGGGCWGWGW